MKLTATPIQPTLTPTFNRPTLTATSIRPVLTATFNRPTPNVSISPQVMGVSMGSPVARGYDERPAYEGAVSVTPSADLQVLQTKDFRMTDDITINPIPQNYGLITYNGSTITVS